MLTPETLRILLLAYAKSHRPNRRLLEAVDLHGHAWEHDLQRAAELERENKVANASLARAEKVFASLRQRIEELERSGETLWPFVFDWMPKNGRARQAAERFYDVLCAGKQSDAT
jgi:hypothetical protein